MPGYHPAMHIVGNAAALLGKKVAVDICRLESRSAQTGNEVSVDIDARARSEAARQLGHGVVPVIESASGVVVLEAAVRFGDQRGDCSATAARVARDPPRD